MPPLATPLPNTRRAELYIGLGLIIMVAAPWLPIAPLVTAVAIICLGATETTLVRFRDKPTLIPILLLHAVTYATLYTLFVGATLHALAATHRVSLNSFAILDLVISILPMAVALKRISNLLWQSPLSRL